MYIKRIVLDGFKSYGVRTEISGFDELFNAVTGLNGSGKSNILDAICFVLGISNLSHVRATNLQELIYKSGQSGVNRATVSITFDNTNKSQCPPGFENLKEINVTRQIIMGGKTKYLINGSNVNNKKVQDLFCSVQLNVNNPHFLIMQGKVTKVLNMKPAEILAMVEEAAGTRMYEVKRQACLKTIEKKDAKLTEMTKICTEEIAPKLEKLRQERSQFMAYQRLERELDDLLAIYQVWQYFESQRITVNAKKILDENTAKRDMLEQKIQENNNKIKEIDEHIELSHQSNKSEESVKLQELESQLKKNEVLEAKATTAAKSIKDSINSEQKKAKQLLKSIDDDEKVLKAKEQELGKVQSLFETLKQNEARDEEELNRAEKRYEALCAGMEVNEQGEAETLQEQLMNVLQEVSQADTEYKKASMEMTACQTQLKAKQKELGNCSNVAKDKSDLNKLQNEVNTLNSNINKINFNEKHMNEVTNRRQELHQNIRALREKIDNFESYRPQTQIHYSDPEPNFDRSRIKGVVCRLITCKDKKDARALEATAGGRLYNVVTDTHLTSKALLQRGRIQNRTTFIPLNKIEARRMHDSVVDLAQNLVGADNCQPALSLLNYDKGLQPAMDYIFGNVFICKNIQVANKVAFNNRIHKKCVTLDGDVVDPAGVLSGGAPQAGESILLQLEAIKKDEEELLMKEREYQKIDAEFKKLSAVHNQYVTMKQQCEMKEHELSLVKQRLEHTAFYMLQEEVNKLKQQIEEYTEHMKLSKENLNKFNKKAKELELKMHDSKNNKKQQLKDAETHMKKMKTQHEKSGNEWKKREHEYRTITLEISELKEGIKNTHEQIKSTEEAIVALQQQLEESTSNNSEIINKVQNLQQEVKAAKNIIAQKNKEVQMKIKEKDQLAAKNHEHEVEIKKMSNDLKQYAIDAKRAYHEEKELSKKIKEDNRHFDRAKAMSHREGVDMERKIKSGTEKKNQLGRTINAKAQTMFEQEEKQFEQFCKKQSIVQNDRKQLLKSMENLDEKKKNSLQLAYEQVSKDFGSIFSTLLPGANARLVAPFGKTILDGLEIKVSLGGVWKESLTELSGGQRSLAALSLILSMLLFKPAPLYILDEVDAALDLSHTQNIGQMLKTHFKTSQFIVVSLKDGMFNNANVLYRTRFIDGNSTVTRSVNKH